jgi:hypothetical protein
VGYYSSSDEREAGRPWRRKQRERETETNGRRSLPDKLMQIASVGCNRGQQGMTRMTMNNRAIPTSGRKEIGRKWLEKETKETEEMCNGKKRKN